MRRRDSDGPSEKLVAEMEERIQALSASHQNHGSYLGSDEATRRCPMRHTADGYDPIDPLSNHGVHFVQRLLESGRQTREVAEILVGLGTGFVANAGMLVCYPPLTPSGQRLILALHHKQFAQLIDFYLQPSQASAWADIQQLATDDSPDAEEKLTRYILEGYRLSNTLALLRVVAPGAEVTLDTEPSGPITVKGGDPIFLSFVRGFPFYSLAFR